MLKVIGNICAALGVALTGVGGAPPWLMYLGLGLKIAADGLKAVGDFKEVK